MKQKAFDYSAVVLTGGSSGIGATFLASILGLNQKVVICNLSRHKPELIEGREDCYHFECDLSKSEAIDEVFPKIEGLLREKCPNGRILLINNSGFGKYGRFQESDLATQLNMIELDVCAVVHLTRLMLPLMIERGGSIINLASALGFFPTPYMATYAATKSFVLDWSLALREELKEHKIKILALCPGATKTGFYKVADAADFDKVKFQSPEEVVEEAWNALESDKGFVVPGFRNKMMVSVFKFLPLLCVTRMVGKLFSPDGN